MADHNDEGKGETYAPPQLLKQSFLVALPIVLTVMLGLVANSILSIIQNAAQREQQKLEFSQSLERQRQQAEVEIILKASEVPASLAPEAQDRQRARNLLWFVDAGYIRLPKNIQTKLREDAKLADGQSISSPVTQSDGATVAAMNYQRSKSMPADGILGPITCAMAADDEKSVPGSVDPQLLGKCRARFKGQ